MKNPHRYFTLLRDPQLEVNANYLEFVKLGTKYLNLSAIRLFSHSKDVFRNDKKYCTSLLSYLALQGLIQEYMYTNMPYYMPNVKLQDDK